ncbi:hypothetical protein CLAFUW4_13952 [Fulvia fulva]|uniref:Uncharacterized protein n=1 Tax=Passalora fulva TaxID=5499 RepID=A0A9Q8UVW4_PASFU|nr:uncharacterized protein CLAFUR5_13792 [Fulvia fulva]KAK4610138.1 hypothetical protein CLAFUR4_13955 [Fulvia fulva]KAK4611391.1 hypothetical protein CLAFUR0_13959 [Fulvia fulva]UJO24398.1 hypothetical protein CLAFUR5_13792 [Fulvia fulva]WPV22227.1 hypothetical protein CLAFUW4_13952 [Fulvia fulva]WPV36745.1 hypothetical protein CLAFUW7_13960 [Fulvia fulva]
MMILQVSRNPSQPGKMASKDPVVTALEPARKILLQQVLNEQGPGLKLNGESTILTCSSQTAETLAEWLWKNKYDMPRGIVVSGETAEHELSPELQRGANIQVVSQVQDGSSTHAFSHIDIYSQRGTSELLAGIHHGLAPNGTAIVTCMKRNPVEVIMKSVFSATGRRNSVGGRESAMENELKSLAMQAGFESERVKVLQENVLVTGQALQKLKDDVERTCDGIMGQSGDSHSWESTLDSTWNREVEKAGGVLIESWLLVAKK